MAVLADQRCNDVEHGPLRICAFILVPDAFSHDSTFNTSEPMAFFFCDPPHVSKASDWELTF